MNFIVLSSSKGTTFQAILDRIADGTLTAQCIGLISDREDRGCIEKAKAARLPYLVVEKKSEESREEYDKLLQKAILGIAKKSQIPNPKSQTRSKTKNQKQETKNLLIACIGWMHILSPWFIAKWRNHILNVHPALLPQYGGEGMYGHRVHETVLRAGEKESGMTIHCMDAQVDTGQILLQKHCPVLPGDTVETLKARVQELEKEWYPKLLQMIHTGAMGLP